MNKTIKAKLLGVKVFGLVAFIVVSGMAACGDKTASDSSLVATSAAEAIQVSKVIQVRDAYIRAMPPGQQVTAMFMTLDNMSAKDHHLISVESKVSDAVELHEHKHVNGMMKMGQVERIAIPKNGSVALVPGGYHVMMIGLKQDLKLGDRVAMKLIFEDGSSRDFYPEVKPINTE